MCIRCKQGFSAGSEGVALIFFKKNCLNPVFLREVTSYQCGKPPILFPYLNSIYYTRMKRTKKPKQTKVRRAKPGPKSGITQDIINQAYKYSLLGLVDWQLAEQFGVTTQTIHKWKRTNEAFRQAVEAGGRYADGEVAKMLLHRALGYSHPAVKFFKIRKSKKEFDPDGRLIAEHSWDEIKQVPYTKHYPPDTKALIKWLQSRNPENWADTWKVEHEHKHLVAGNINIHTVLEELGDPGKFSDQELRVAAKMGLQKLLEQKDKQDG